MPARAALLAVVLLLSTASAAPAREGSRFRPAVSGRLGVIATESPAAAKVGRAVLERGGNAIDAAASIVFALNAARPQSCGIGGGGFLLYRSAGGATAALDFRETAPKAITPTTFTGPGLYSSFTGHTTVGVPGTLAGMAAALRRYGTITLAQAIAPAERLARRGVRVLPSLSASMAQNAKRLQLFPAAAHLYLRNGQPYAAGAVLRNRELAATLRRIMHGGTRAFYRGVIARRIVRDMRKPRPQTKDAGLLTMSDFARYRAKWRKPLKGSYRGERIFAMPPPTSGGVAILEMLNILEGFDLAGAGQSSATADHLMAEAEKIAFADRNAYVADPDFVRQPTAQLISKRYGAQRRGEIDPLRAKTYMPGQFGATARAAGADANPASSTTHVSVIDARGDAVAVTCTIEQEFGSAVAAPGTGFLLNNELTDFSAAGTANEPRPFKRPRSSMSPVIVVKHRRPVLVGGGAGGARIIMGVLLSIVDTIDFKLDLAHAVDAERFDDLGGNPLMIEDARVDPAVLADLQARGHPLVREGEYGARPRVQLAGVAADGVRSAVSDPRADQGSLAQRRSRVGARTAQRGGWRQAG
jgi:gamma-glutamyltranspeptidase/glutathione hydrolase